MRVGTWRVGDDEWPVDSETLHQIVENFSLAKERGCDCPVVFNHSSDVRDRCGLVHELATDGKTLWANAEITDDGVNVARKPGVGVSVRVTEGWTDGLGNPYDLFLEHLGIVSHPVVAGQGPFVQLSLISEGEPSMIFGKKTRSLAAGDTTSTPTAAAATIDDLKPVLARIVKAAAKLSNTPGLDTAIENATDETLISTLNIVADVLAGMAGEEKAEGETDTAATPTADSVAGMDPASMSYAQMSAAFPKLKAFAMSLVETQQQVAQAALISKQVEYRRELDRLSKAGVIDIDGRNALTDVGAKSGYNMSLLKTFSDKVPAVHTKSKTLSLADGSEPAIETGQRKSFSQLSSEEREEKIKAFVGR